MKVKQPPDIRLKRGPLVLSGWKNTSKKGEEFYTVRINRPYRTGAGTMSYSGDIAEQHIDKAIELLIECKDLIAEARGELKGTLDIELSPSPLFEIHTDLEWQE